MRGVSPLALLGRDDGLVRLLLGRDDGLVICLRALVS